MFCSWSTFALKFYWAVVIPRMLHVFSICCEVSSIYVFFVHFFDFQSSTYVFRIPSHSCFFMGGGSSRAHRWGLSLWAPLAWWFSAPRVIQCLLLGLVMHVLLGSPNISDSGGGFWELHWVHLTSDGEIDPESFKEGWSCLEIGTPGFWCTCSSCQLCDLGGEL